MSYVKFHTVKEQLTWDSVTAVFCLGIYRESSVHFKFRLSLRDIVPYGKQYSSNKSNWTEVDLQILGIKVQIKLLSIFSCFSSGYLL